MTTTLHTFFLTVRHICVVHHQLDGQSPDNGPRQAVILYRRSARASLSVRSAVPC